MQMTWWVPPLMTGSVGGWVGMVLLVVVGWYGYHTHQLQYGTGGGWGPAAAQGMCHHLNSRCVGGASSTPRTFHSNFPQS